MNYDDIVVFDFVLRTIWKNCRFRIQNDLEHDENNADAYYCSGYYFFNSWRTCKNGITDSYSNWNRMFA